MGKNCQKILNTWNQKILIYVSTLYMETWLGTFRCTFSLLFIFSQQMIFPALWKLIGCVILAILLVATSIAVPPALLLSGSATTTPPGTTDLITTIPTTIDPMTTNQTQLQQHKILLNWYIHSSIYYSFFLILLLCNYVTGCILYFWSIIVFIWDMND